MGLFFILNIPTCCQDFEVQPPEVPSKSANLFSPPPSQRVPGPLKQAPHWHLILTTLSQQLHRAKHPFLLRTSQWMSSALQILHRPLPGSRLPAHTCQTLSKSSSAGQPRRPEKFFCPLRVNGLFSEKLIHPPTPQTLILLPASSFPSWKRSKRRAIYFVCLFIFLLFQ